MTDRLLDGVTGAEILRTRFAAADVRAAVLDHPHATADDLRALLGADTGTHRLRMLRNNGSLVAYRVVRRGIVFPLFQFETERGRIRPCVVKANRRLRRLADESAVLVWWLSSPHDAAARPMDLAALGKSQALSAVVESDLVGPRS